MLNGKTAIVTGASRGIGAAIARKLASMGANIAIVDYTTEDNAKEVMNSITGVEVKFYRCDVSSTDECKAVVQQVVTDLGGVDILVNNAGITADNLIVMMDESDFDRVINTNLKGCYNMIKACARGFIKKKYGKIINISSISGLCGLPGQANYSASKAGVIGITKSIAKELGSKNICCNAIAPGFIMTGMTENLGSEEEFLKSIPLRRLGKPEDVANLAAFLADEASDYITGEVIRIDGGLAM
ncbi:MAG: 3-oxoacyl-[Clostridia bacterium]|nr:3-oxoacyl-[acyl-carrier-protein] reductase [Clostridia bacterium]